MANSGNVPRVTSSRDNLCYRFYGSTASILEGRGKSGGKQINFQERRVQISFHCKEKRMVIYDHSRSRLKTLNPFLTARNFHNFYNKILSNFSTEFLTLLIFQQGAPISTINFTFHVIIHLK